MIEIKYDKIKIEEGQVAGVYTDDGFQWSESRQRIYPSKLMFIKYLEDTLRHFPELEGVADVWSMNNYAKDEAEINVKLTFKISDKTSEKSMLDKPKKKHSKA